MGVRRVLHGAGSIVLALLLLALLPSMATAKATVLDNDILML